MYLMQSILVQSLLCCNLPEGAFYMLVRLAQPSRNVFEQQTSWLQQLQAAEAKPLPEKQSEKCEVSGRYFFVDGQIPSFQHILTGLFVIQLLSNLIIKDYCISF